MVLVAEWCQQAGRTVSELYRISLVPVPGAGLKVDTHPGDTVWPTNSGLLPAPSWLGLAPTGGTGWGWGTQRQGSWPRTLYSMDMG